MKKIKLRTKSRENSRTLFLKKSIGLERLGLMTSQLWYDDPKGLLFSLSRYKFVSKILADYRDVLELGCGDGFQSRVVQQNVKNLEISDHDPLFIEDIKSRNPKKWSIHSFVHNMCNDSTKKKYNAIYALDVFEHIVKSKEKLFLNNIAKSLKDNGTVILGVPSLESQKHASPLSKMGHVNCKTADSLKKTLSKSFQNISIFSMNDEVVHTGFFKMAHYLFAVCYSKKTKKLKG
jgi:2-polyprenyl-3-methyl-5-hydroxy-6-metoxy-1,4-benzoquinol methylase